MGLFPAYIEADTTIGVEEKQTLPKEYEIDFATGQLTGRIVEGREAIKVWIWLALRVPRYRFFIYTWDYGNEFEELIGQGYSEEYIEAEAQRMTEECLLVNEYIQDIQNFSLRMENSCLTIGFTANTLYGVINFEDEKIAA